MVVLRALRWVTNMMRQLVAREPFDCTTHVFVSTKRASREKTLASMRALDDCAMTVRCLRDYVAERDVA